MKTLAERLHQRYRGKMAAGYEEHRKKQGRWWIEDENVSRILADARGRVLDVPVGTGRFLPLYKKLGLRATGVDSSEVMLSYAKKKRTDAALQVGDARHLEFKDKEFDSVVCFRFLNLIDEDAMRSVVKELLRVAKTRVVLTVRLGPKYVTKTTTAEHDKKKFLALVKSCGFRVHEEVAVFKKGWTIMTLVRT